MEVRLGEKDRNRFGCTEVLDLDLTDISIADLEELSERFKFDPFDWPIPIQGEVPFEQAGNPDAERERPRWQIHACVWIALHQAGHDVSWAEAGTVAAMKVGFGKPEEVEGKAESPSPTSDGSGTPPSDTSTPA